jgi:menaquinone-dependent protoporphyrinogen oxidase
LARVLVVHASKRGSTREVAEAVAATLGEHGLGTDVCPAAESPDVGAYDGVVVGTSLYMGRAHPAARSFLSRNRRALAAVPVAVFGMGPLTMDDKAVAGSRKQLDRALGKVPDVHPVAVAVFGGVVEPKRLPFPFSRMPASDARDWAAIHTWAAEVAEAVAPSTATR